IEKRIFDGLNAELVPVKDFDSPESLDVLRRAQVLIIALHKVNAQVMDAMPNCKLISRLGVGIDNIDVPAATAHGIWVANVPDYGVDEVATHALALMLTQLRGLPTLVNATRAGIYDGQAVRPIQRLTKLTLGVMGY